MELREGEGSGRPKAPGRPCSASVQNKQHTAKPPAQCLPPGRLPRSSAESEPQALKVSPPVSLDGSSYHNGLRFGSEHTDQHPERHSAVAIHFSWSGSPARGHGKSDG